MRHQIAASSGSGLTAPPRTALPSFQDALCSQLEHLPSLADVAAQPEQHTYPALLAGGDPARAARARQAHALALAESKPGSRWWLPLKQLNQHCEAAAAAGGRDVFLGIGEPACQLLHNFIGLHAAQAGVHASCCTAGK